MSDHPQSDRLEAVLTLPRGKVKEMVVSLAARCTLLNEAELACKTPSHRSILRAANLEVGELRDELQWHVSEKRPYHYVMPLTLEEGRAINEELNGGPGTTHP